MIVAIMLKVATTCTKHTKAGNWKPLTFPSLLNCILLYIKAKLFFNAKSMSAIPYSGKKASTACAFLTYQMKTPNKVLVQILQLDPTSSNREKHRGRTNFNNKAACVHVKLFYWFHMSGRNIIIILCYTSLLCHELHQDNKIHFYWKIKPFVTW